MLNAILLFIAGVSTTAGMGVCWARLERDESQVSWLKPGVIVLFTAGVFVATWAAMWILVTMYTSGILR